MTTGKRTSLWFGSTPPGWTLDKLGRWTSIGNGSTPSRERLEYWHGGTHPWLNSSVVNHAFVDGAEQFVTDQALRECHLPWVAAGALLVGLTGQGKTRGMTTQLRTPATINQHLAHVTPDNRHWTSDYLLLLLQAAYSELRRVSDENGSTKGGLTCADLKALLVPRPPLVEQVAIAALVHRETEKIEALISKQEQLIDRAQERKQALVDTLVWTGLNQAELAATGIDPAPTAPAHWGRARNRHLLRERTDLSSTGTEEMLSVSHITGVTPRSDKNVTMFEAESTVGYRLVASGDLVINTMWAWMGALGVSRHAGMVSPAYGVYTFHRKVDVRFFEYLYRSRSYVAEMTRYSRGIWSSRLRLYPASFLRLNVVVPPLEEQTLIADHLDDRLDKLDKLIQKTQRFIELSKERRAALIAAAVTGQIDVRGDAA